MVTKILSEKNLLSFDQKKIDIFTYDLHNFFEIYKKIYETFETDYSSLPDKNKKRFKELIKEWNSKYHNIAMQVDERFNLKIFFNIMFEDAIKITKEMINFLRIEMSEEQDSATAHFKGNNTLTLESSGNYTSLIFLDEDMLDHSSPEFRLCTIFGLSGYDESISLKKFFQDFAFSSSEVTVSWYRNRGSSSRYS